MSTHDIEYFCRFLNNVWAKAVKSCVCDLPKKPYSQTFICAETKLLTSKDSFSSIIIRNLKHFIYPDRSTFPSLQLCTSCSVQHWFLSSAFSPKGEKRGRAVSHNNSCLWNHLSAVERVSVLRQAWRCQCSLRLFCGDVWWYFQCWSVSD